MGCLHRSLVFASILLVFIVPIIFLKFDQIEKRLKRESQPVADKKTLDNGKGRLLYEITEYWEAEALHDALMDHVEVKCKDIQGKGKGDGKWNICMDQLYQPKSPCLVYSFGIADDFSFDDALASMGCEVHSFDPSMKEKDHKHAKHVWFHNLGVGVNNTDTFTPRKDYYVKDDQKWKIRTVATIIKALGHEGRTIDIIKIDIEHGEFYIIKDMLETGVFDNVRQFLVEYHVYRYTRHNFVEFFKITRELYDAGFRRFFSFRKRRKNCCKQVGYNLANVGFYNTKFGS